MYDMLLGYAVKKQAGKRCEKGRHRRDSGSQIKQLLSSCKMDVIYRRGCIKQVT